MYAVCIETGSVAVVGILALEAEIENDLHLSVSRNISHIQACGGGRRSTEVNDICTAADGAKSYDVAILEVELVDALNCSVALQVVRGT